MVISICEFSARRFTDIFAKPTARFLAGWVGNRMEVKSQVVENAKNPFQ
jgi:hypothetical protein